MMFFSMQTVLKYTLVAKIDKSEYGKTQCIYYFYIRNGKNKAVKAHSGTILKLSLSK